MSPRWVVYPFVAFGFLVALAALAGGTDKSHGAAAWAVYAVLALLALAVPIALLVWNRGLGVRVSDGGIVSVGLNDVHVIPWATVHSFSVDRYRDRYRFAVYANLRNGERIALYALQGRSWQRKRLDRFCGELQVDQQTHSGASSASSEALGVPLGWRRRVHHVELQAEQDSPPAAPTA